MKNILKHLFKKKKQKNTHTQKGKWKLQESNQKPLQ